MDVLLIILVEGIIVYIFYLLTDSLFFPSFTMSFRTQFVDKKQGGNIPPFWLINMFRPLQTPIGRTYLLLL